LPPLDFIAELTQHIPPSGTRYISLRKADHRLPNMQFQRAGRVGVAEDPAGSRSEPRRP
jgi:hypothetical protein